MWWDVVGADGEGGIAVSQSAENDALRRAVERLAERYENTSRDTWSRPDVVADNLRRILDQTRVLPPEVTP